MTSDRRASDDEPAGGPTRLRPLLLTCAALGLACLVVYWPGCREYPPVSSRESLYLMKLLYAACNTKDPVRLAKVEEGLAKATREGKVSPAEQEAFAKIIALAHTGDWPEAERAALKFAEDQIGQGTAPHAPHDHGH